MGYHVDFLDHEGPIPVAHRGGMGEAAPNSFEAVERTDRLGCFLETDISVTSDGVPFLWHPQGLDRLRPHQPLSPQGRGLRNLDLQAIRSDGAQAVALLDDVLYNFPDLHVFIDVKQWPGVLPTAQAIARNKAMRRVSIGTFSQARTAAVVSEVYHLTREHVSTGLGPLAAGKLALQSVLPGRSRAQFSADSAQLPYKRVNRRIIDTAHTAGLAVIPWTVNTEHEMHRLLDAGVDGIMTDYPSVLVDLIAKRSVRY
jgi:glycerophosphoryl diester phosphodiesterase